MYLPEHFQPAHPDDAASLVTSHPFGMLVTVPGGIPFINHLPFLYDSTAGTHGRLYGHMARANLQWQHLLGGEPVLVVFQGPHAYVSPTWYNSPGVPTWNYAVVHLRGTPRLIEGEAELEDLIRRQTRIYESLQPVPWEPALTGDRRARLLSRSLASKSTSATFRPNSSSARIARRKTARTSLQNSASQPIRQIRLSPA